MVRPREWVRFRALQRAHNVVLRRNLVDGFAAEGTRPLGAWAVCPQVRSCY